MSETGLVIQAKILEVVTGAVTPTPVYDHAPQDTSPLYVLIGDDTSTPDNTKNVSGQEHLVEINLFSSQRGFKETKQTTKKIYDALHRVPLALNNGQRVIPQFDFSEFFRDPDGPRGVMRFRIQT